MYFKVKNNLKINYEPKFKYSLNHVILLIMNLDLWISLFIVKKNYISKVGSFCADDKDKEIWF
jgi:hypothetical protein